MAEVHTTIKSDASGNVVKFDNPGIPPLPQGAGQPVTQTKDTSGKVISTSGTTAGVTHVNPA